MHEYIFLTGLPRSGSTLLSSLLSQNPNIHAGGNSPVCQLMWDTYVSITQNCNRQFSAANKDSSEFVESIIDRYYKDVQSKFVVDKCRSWGHESNLYVIKKFITPNPKFIVLLRPTIEIFASFIKLYDKNKVSEDPIYQSMHFDNSEPILRSYNCTLNLINNHFNNCFFVFYDDLVNNPLEIIDQIYSFCGISKYKHTTENIINKFPEDDSTYGLRGMHHVRPTISKDSYTVKIKEKYILDLCENLDTKLINDYHAKIYSS